MGRLLVLLLSGLLFAGNLQALSPATDRQPVSGQAVTQQDQPSAGKDSSKKSGKGDGPDLTGRASVTFCHQGQDRGHDPGCRTDG